jgi:hypothetical protein
MARYEKEYEHIRTLADSEEEFEEMKRTFSPENREKLKAEMREAGLVHKKKRRFKFA